MQSEARLRHIERLTDLPLMILAVLFIPILLVPLFFEPHESISAAFDAGEWVIWAIFFVVLVIKTAVAPQRVAYLRRNWFEVLVVAVPFLRPLRILRAARVAVIIGVNTSILDRLAANKGLRGIVLTVLVITAAGATLAFGFERQAEGSNITNFGDALWWAFVTSTTVGYGDTYPVTAGGRGVAIVLMLLGIAALSAVTATVAAFLTHENAESQASAEPEDNMAIVLARLDELQREIAALREEGRVT